jgi:phage gp46-like protein
MSDVALVQSDGGIMPAFDFDVANGDIIFDDGLKTPVILSLFTDRTAEPDDILPNGGNDRRGWWGDLPVTASDERDVSGSRLWLLDRAKALVATATMARHYIAEALKWLIDDGVAKSVTVETNWNAPGFLAIHLTLFQADDNGAVDSKFDFLWKASL